MFNRLKKTATYCLLSLLVFSCHRAAKEQPNVIIIFPDQFRQYSLGFWSQKDNAKHINGNPDPVNTPTLDKLANEGLVFNRAMSNFPLCSPYRGMLLSGQYPSLNGLTANCREDRMVGIKMDGNAIADIFDKAGYETAYFGKCHWVKTEPLFDTEGTYKGTTEPPGGHFINTYDTYVPPGASRLGFNYFFQTLRDTHKDPLCYSNDPQLIEGRQDGQLHQPKEFNAKIESEALIKYLQNTHEQRNTDKPFFVVWSLNPPHNPWTEESTDMRFFDQYLKEGEVKIENLLLRENANQQVGDYAPYYFANVSAVDYYIGKVLDELKKIGEEENTIIVFTSDHGEMLGSHGFTGKPFPENEACNIPFIIKWGKKLKHRVEDLIIGVPDVMPTLLGMSGLQEMIPASVQGHNFADIVLNKDRHKTQKPGSVLYFDYNSRGLYTGDFTFVVKTSDGTQFEEAFYYDNKKDPYQMTKIKGDAMDVKLVGKWKKELANKLISINDKWAQEKICKEYLNY